MDCTNCGSAVSSDERFCGDCGQQISVPETQPEIVEKTVVEEVRVEDEPPKSDGPSPKAFDAASLIASASAGFQTAAVKTRGLSSRTLLIGTGALVGVVLFVVLVSRIFGSGGGGSDLIVLEGDSDSGTLHIVAAGEGLTRETELMRRPSLSDMTIVNFDRRAELTYGSAISHQGHIVYLESDNGRRQLVAVSPEGESEQLLNVGDGSRVLLGQVSGDVLAVRFSDGESTTCARIDGLNRAELITRSDYCDFGEDDGELKVVAFDIESEGSRLRVMNFFNGDVESDIQIDARPFVLGQQRLLAVSAPSSFGEFFIVYDENGEELANSPEVSEVEGGVFTETRAGLVRTSDMDGRTLWGISPSGDIRPLASGTAAQAAVTPKGSSALLAVSDGTSGYDLLFADLAGTEDPTELGRAYEGSGRIFVDEANSRFLIDVGYGSSAELLAVSFSGELGEKYLLGDGIVSSAWSVNGQVFATVQEDSGVILMSFDAGDEVRELGFYSDLSVVGATSDALIITAFDGSRELLVAIPLGGDGSPQELYSGERIFYPIVASGNQLWATAAVDGSSGYYDVISLELDSTQFPETLYQDSRIVGAADMSTILSPWLLVMPDGDIQFTLGDLRSAGL